MSPSPVPLPAMLRDDEVALAAPDRALGLWPMGCNPGAPRDPEAADRLRQRVQAGEVSAVVEELGARSVFPAGPNAAAARETSRTMALRLARIECPTLVTWGREDAFSDVGHAALVASRIPSADLDDQGGTDLAGAHRGPRTSATAGMLLDLTERLSIGLFAGAALYVTLAGHPARLRCGPALAIAGFGRKMAAGIAFTLVVILPTNKRLLDPALDPGHLVGAR